MKSNSDRITKHFLRDAIMNGAERVQEDGGPGSGNFGHKGRPGLRGGSGKGGAKPEMANASYGAPVSSSAKQNNARIKDGIAQYRKRAEAEGARYPEGSKERKWAQKALNTLQSTNVRPTPEETKALQQANLGNISSSLKPYAVEKYKKAVINEPKITSDLLDICDATGAEMYGLKYRQKSAADKNGSCRIDEKIQEYMEKARQEEAPITYEQAVDKLSDLVRYTQACTKESMDAQYAATRKALEAKGYKCIKVKNTWDTFNEENAYRGVNTVFMSPDGVKFELQFHTPESLYTKEFMHEMYEEARTPGTAPERVLELNRQMLELSKKMERPNNVERIKFATDKRRVWK